MSLKGSMLSERIQTKPFNSAYSIYVTFWKRQKTGHTLSGTVGGERLALEGHLVLVGVIHHDAFAKPQRLVPN